RDTAIKIAVLAPHDTSSAAQLRLRDITEQLREDLLQLDEVTQANIQGAQDYEINIEVPEATLRRYGLSLQDVAQAVRRENLDLPAGLLKSPSQDVLLKGENKRVIGVEIEDIPLVTDPNGVVLSVGDIASVRDEFAETTNQTRINGRPALNIEVQKTSDEDLIVVTDAVKKFAEDAKVPAGYDLLVWDDRSVEVKDRINLLAKNSLQGLVLVFLCLALFLDLRLAFWVAAGIPISFLGACIILLVTGQTINMLSLFGFLMVIGILVDDGIVIGENIYTHRERGKNALQAAIDGTIEVFPSVFASIVTTLMAFLPLMFIAGVMGKFIAVLPGAAIACLIVSLFESSLVLPVHLRHEASEKSFARRSLEIRSRMSLLWRWTLGPLLVAGGTLLTGLWLAVYPIAAFLKWLNPYFSRGFDRFAGRVYVPALRSVLRHPGLTICTALTIMLLTAGLVAGGIVRYEFFPKLDVPRVEATVIYPDGTPEDVTAAAVMRIHDALERVNRRFTEDGQPPVKTVQDSVGYVTGQGSSGQMSLSSGSHLGKVEAELVDPSLRTVPSEQIVNAWREEAGEFAGTESIVFQSPAFGPAGKKIEFKLLAPRDEASSLDEAVEKVKAKLAAYPGVFDVDDDSRPGKAELQVDLKPTAVALGVQRADLFETVRAAYFGEEVMRVQRGRHEVKIMVRFPESDRRSFADFDDIRVRSTDPVTRGVIQRPITELADVSIGRGPSEINRVNRLRSVTIYCDVDEAVGNTADIVSDLEANGLPPMLADHPGVSVLWKGQQQQQSESTNSMFIGMACAIIGMFALLTIEFKSYLQPLLILMIIPFGIVGAVLGHWLLDLPISFFSTMGLVALTGVVVNDSIVLIDFVNMKLKDGLGLNEALFEAGTRRIRPVFLTSATTVAGLMPMVFERSFQAQLLVPMAAAICFGLM
ncbi:MAG: efflux RND transporter permease subunit, partial [Planctomycetota bacterium]|nr:efflux RND transporter permease subunit [Planctomycetota bacterium]